MSILTFKLKHDIDVSEHLARAWDVLGGRVCQYPSKGGMKKMYEVIETCIKDMLKELKDPAANCCGNPTCNVSLTPPFLERARCGGCGKFCDGCDVNAKKGGMIKI